MKTANLDNFDAIHEEVAKVMEKELDKCGSMKIMIQGEHDKGWEQVKMRMEQLQAAKQKIQEMEESTCLGCRIAVSGDVEPCSTLPVHIAVVRDR
ncbi:unnamed protein product [Symbiodinium sp. CCMP2456]|nr:unnamed protein product [Symbiodinium sp. CCMP2456]